MKAENEYHAKEVTPEMVQWIIAERKKNKTPNRVFADKLNADGYTTSGGSKIYPVTVSQLCLAEGYRVRKHSKRRPTLKNINFDEINNQPVFPMNGSKVASPLQTNSPVFVPASTIKPEQTAATATDDFMLDVIANNKLSREQKLKVLSALL
jgi:hypothetical protein